MCGKPEDLTVEPFRLQQYETPQPISGWLTEAQRLLLGAMRTHPCIARAVA
jgi:hypothetical protein